MTVEGWQRDLLARSRSGLVHAGLLLLVVAAAYANSIPNGFVWDDLVQIETRVPDPMPLWRIMTGPSWLAMQHDPESSARAIDTYRPLLLLSFIADATLWGDHAYGYHLTNVLLFAACCVLLLAILRRFTSNAWAALACAAVFASLPGLTESVSWISGRHDVLMALWMLGASLAACIACERTGLRRAGWFGISLLGFCLALLSKEPALLYPLVLALLLGLSPLRQSLSAAERRGWLTAHWLLALLYLFYRSAVVAEGNLVGGGGGVLAALRTAPAVATRYIGDFFYRPHLTSHYLDAPIVAFDVRNFWLPASLHVSLLAAAFAYRRRSWVPLFGLCAYYALLSPAAVMVANKPEYSLRFAFLPSLGLLLATAALLGRAYGAMSGRVQMFAAGAVGVLIALQVLRVHARNQDYASDYSFYASIIRDVPDSPQGYYGLGLWFQKHGRPAEAELAYLSALQRGPHDGRAYNNLGVLLLEQRRLQQARAVLTRGVEQAPGHARLFYNLGAVHAALGARDQAERAYLRALELEPGYRQPYEQLYQLYLATDARRAIALRSRMASSR